jgi:hypothetical protein
MTASQSILADALLDPAAPVPAGLVDPRGRPAGRRFAVYRNNVAVSLTEALETGFPVLRKLLGDANFKSLSGLFLRRHPPASPLLMHYGAMMPAFLERLPQLAHLPYLADVARLELALRESYHAADAEPVAPAEFETLPAEDLVRARLTLAPAVRVLSSPWPVLSIWERNSRDGAPKPAMRPEDVVVVRPAFDPEPRRLFPGGAAFVKALQVGLTVGEAFDRASVRNGFDPAGPLAALLSGGAITNLEMT